MLLYLAFSQIKSQTNLATLFYICQNNNKRHSRKMLASNGLKSKLLGKLTRIFKIFAKNLIFFNFQLLVGALPVLSLQLWYQKKAKILNWQYGTKQKELVEECQLLGRNLWILSSWNFLEKYYRMSKNRIYWNTFGLFQCVVRNASFQSYNLSFL